MKNLSSVKATNELADLVGASLLNQEMLSAPFKQKKEPKKTELVSVRLAPDLSDTLDILAFKFNKSRGVVARILLEMAIFQLGGENNALSPENKQAFDILMSRETKTSK